MRTLTLESTPETEPGLCRAAESMIFFAFKLTATSSAPLRLESLFIDFPEFEAGLISSLPASSLTALQFACVDLATLQNRALTASLQQLIGLRELLIYLNPTSDQASHEQDAGRANQQLPKGLMTCLQALTRLRKMELYIYNGLTWPTLCHLPPSLQELKLYVEAGKCLVDIPQLTGLERLEVTAPDGFAEGSALPACAAVVSLSDTPLPERPWQLLAGVQQLEITWPDGKSAGVLAQLSGLQSLTSLSLSCPGASDAAAAATAWKHLPQLRGLQLSIKHAETLPEDQSHCEDTVRAISMVEGLTSLRLGLPRKSTFPWAVHIAQLQNLHQLVVSRANSSRQDMLQLKKLIQLTALSLKWCSLGDAAAVAVLGRLTKLQTLRLIQGHKRQGQLSDAVVPVLEQLQGLRKLSLQSPEVGENSMELLEGLTQLTSLRVELSHKRRQHLKRVLGCKVLLPKG
jgi:Leucine-rich repeat (LRR) protein